MVRLSMPQLRPLAKGEQSDEQIEALLRALDGGETLLVTFVVEVAGAGLKTRRKPLRAAHSVGEVRRILEDVVRGYEGETEFSAVNDARWTAFMRLAEQTRR